MEAKLGIIDNARVEDLYSIVIVHGVEMLTKLQDILVVRHLIQLSNG